jgi:hypothetical protein
MPALEEELAVAGRPDPAARFAEAVWEAVAESGRPSSVVAAQRGRVRLREFSSAIDPERAEAARRGYLLEKALSRR